MMHPKTIKAIAVVAEGKLEVVELPFPEHGEYECLVRFTASGYCSGTDKKIVHNKLAGMTIQYPTILGHEGVGYVVECGAKVRNFQVGDRIAGPLGKFPRDHYSATFGCMVQYGVVHDVVAINEDQELLFGSKVRDPRDYPAKKIPDYVSDVDAAMLLTFKENYSALKNFGMQPGMDVLIYGDGSVANGVALFAQQMGAGWLGVVGHHEDRLDRVERTAGPDQIFNSSQVSLVEAMADRKVDLVIDCVGNLEIVKEGAAFLRPGGRVAIYGVLSRANADLNLLDLPNNVCVQILNWPYHEHREHEAILELIKAGKLNPKDFYSHVLPMEDCQKGADLIEKREAYKVIFTMD